MCKDLEILCQRESSYSDSELPVSKIVKNLILIYMYLVAWPHQRGSYTHTHTHTQTRTHKSVVKVKQDTTDKHFLVKKYRTEQNRIEQKRAELHSI